MVLKKFFKIIAIILAILTGLIILTLSGYIIYLSATYYRIEDNLSLTIDFNKTKLLELNKNYKKVW